MSLLRSASLVAGGLVVLVAVAASGYHYGYSTCYHELNQLNRPNVGNLLSPGDDTMIIRDLQRECLDLESKLIGAEREVHRLKLTVDQRETHLTQDSM